MWIKCKLHPYEWFCIVWCICVYVHIIMYTLLLWCMNNKGTRDFLLLFYLFIYHLCFFAFIVLYDVNVYAHLFHFCFVSLLFFFLRHFFTLVTHNINSSSICKCKVFSCLLCIIWAFVFIQLTLPFDRKERKCFECHGMNLYSFVITNVCISFANSI